MSEGQGRVRLGSAFFNADHTQLASELRRVEEAGLDFLHLDVFDGHFVEDLGFAPKTIAALRKLTRLPFEVHLAVEEPLRFIPALARCGVDLVFLPAERTPLLYEAIFTVREHGLKVGLCLALGTPLQVLEGVLPLLDAVLLLGRVTGEGERGRTFNDLLLPRLRRVRQWIETGGYAVDLQAAGGLETQSCWAAVEAGATSLPLGQALHREPDLAAYVAHLRSVLEQGTHAFDGDPAAPAALPDPPRGAGEKKTHHYRVLVTSRSFGPHCPEAVARLQAAGCELVTLQPGRPPTEEELLSLIGDVDAMIAGTEPITGRVLAQARRLRVIARHGVGYEHIDLEAARTQGIIVAIAGDVIAESVADMTLALLLSLVRRVPQGDRAVRQGQWPRCVGMELRGKVCGLIGLGRIGKAVCRRVRGFGMRVVAADVYHDDLFAANWGINYLSLDELLSLSDVVSLHVPLTAETFHLINRERLASMKPGAYLINTARGELIDEEALVEALRSGHLAGAACDVFEHEPPGPHPLLTLETVIATPHSAGQTLEGLRRLGEVTVENVLRVLAGGEPCFRVV
ncbi:NAD(P)-dependent oxidoreductase [Thermogemmatispora sp.]|uniref:NAD(P)-dependent oxidoreductase n=1 Tax=Thermogemmatispora sp. TaxID=1968838 RepID=UPI0035E433DE